MMDGFTTDEALDTILAGATHGLGVIRLRLLVHGLVALSGERGDEYVRSCAQKVREDDTPNSRTSVLQRATITGLL